MEFSAKNLSKEHAKAYRRWRKLSQEIAHHNRLYYQLGQPEISDFEYDCLLAELRSLEQRFPEFTTVPEQVGDDRVEGFATFPHGEPMLSLENSYAQEDLEAFDQRLEKGLDIQRLKYGVEPKIDGIAVSLIYEQGRFVRALTRGDGREGDDVTHTISTIQEFPRQLLGDRVPEKVEIRGEVFIAKEAFERINAEQQRLGLELYANPRNLAAGTVKNLDARVAKERSLGLFVYGIGACEPPYGAFFETYCDLLKILHAWGLPVLQGTQFVCGFEEMWGAIQDLENVCSTLPYVTDGAVVKLNSLADQKRVGMTAKAPRWAIAFKFKPKEAKTVVHKIELQIGRTGVVTPVAELEPVVLDGSLIARVTLHNADEIARKDVREGDTVVIAKAGDVIPSVVSVDLESRSNASVPFAFPENCPSCRSPLLRLEGEVAWRCVSADCPAQKFQRLRHFVSKQAMDIKYLGEALLDQLIQKGYIAKVVDLYRLKRENLLTLDQIGEKSAEKVLANIEKSKQNPLWRLIHGLGIPHVGVELSKLLARECRNLEGLQTISEENLLAIKGIGGVIAQAIRGFFSNEHNRSLVAELRELGLNFWVDREGLHAEQESAQGGNFKQETVQKVSAFQGKTIVFTGILQQYTRSEAEKLAESLGAKVASQVTSTTDFLVVGKKPSKSKLGKAEKFGVKVLNEEVFLGLD